MAGNKSFLYLPKRRSIKWKCMLIFAKCSSSSSQFIGGTPFDAAIINSSHFLLPFNVRGSRETFTLKYYDIIQKIISREKLDYSFYSLVLFRVH